MENSKSRPNQKDKPRGIYILGGFNVLLGSLGLWRYFSLNPQAFNQALDTFKESGFQTEASFQQFKTYGAITFIFSSLILLSGLGVLLKKEWGRRLCVYFAFAVIVLLALGVFLQPAFIKLIFPQIIYFSLLIFYFTNKNVERHFTRQKKDESKTLNTKP